MRRSIRMPETADLQAIKAKYENGVLNLDIPKHKVRLFLEVHNVPWCVCE
jgi:HSP20 family molecular chaperone IbpA